MAWRLELAQAELVQWFDLVVYLYVLELAFKYG